MKKMLFVMLAVLVCYAPAFASSDSGHGKAHWGYSGEGAPEHWGGMDPKFAACRDGRSQSPINIVGTVDANLPAIEMAYQAVPLKIVNNGHAIQVNYAPGSKMSVGGKTYDLLQFHFHSLSENTINGQYFPLEAHLVHKDASGKLGVVGVMYKEGAANAALERIWKYIRPLAGATMEVSDSFNVLDILPEGKDYYAFDGSLTTPPCSEGVKWMVLKDAVEISPAQIQKFQKTLGYANNRPVQPLNGRSVLY